VAPQSAAAFAGELRGARVGLAAFDAGLGVVEAGSAGDQQLERDVVAVVVDVPQQPSVEVPTGLGRVAGQDDGRPDRREVAQGVGGGVCVALGRVRWVGDFGGVDASLGSSELSVTTCLEGAFACWVTRVDGDVLRLHRVRDYA
jgi:hypothetical protein